MSKLKIMATRDLNFLKKSPDYQEIETILIKKEVNCSMRGHIPAAYAAKVLSYGTIWNPELVWIEKGYGIFDVKWTSEKCPIIPGINIVVEHYSPRQLPSYTTIETRFNGEVVFNYHSEYASNPITDYTPWEDGTIAEKLSSCSTAEEVEFQINLLRHPLTKDDLVNKYNLEIEKIDGIVTMLGTIDMGNCQCGDFHFYIKIDMEKEQFSHTGESSGIPYLGMDVKLFCAIAGYNVVHFYDWNKENL